MPDFCWIQLRQLMICCFSPFYIVINGVFWGVLTVDWRKNKTFEDIILDSAKTCDSTNV